MFIAASIGEQTHVGKLNSGSEYIQWRDGFKHYCFGIKIMLRIIILMCAFLVNSLVLAEPTVLKPDIHIGDMWEYQTIDGFTNEVIADHLRKLVATDNDELTVEVTFKGKSQRTLYFLTKDWNLKDNGTSRYEPFLPELKFPLFAGDSWSKEYTTTNVNGNAFKSFLKAKVNPPEKVQTPAGDFDAYRIDYQVDTTGLGESGRVFHDIKTLWYSPKVNAFVRREIISSSEGRVRKKEVTELLRYTPHEVEPASAYPQQPVPPPKD